MREMRDSGVEWIGEIPKDWNCCKQKYRFTLINGRAFKDNEFEEDGTYRILRVGNLFSNPVWYSSSLELEPDKYCEKGDLIYAWSMSYGPYIWNEEKVIYHYHIWKTKLVSDMDKMFSYYYLQALTESIKSQTHETTMGFVTMGIMNNSYIAYPRNIKEQKKIDKLRSYLDAPEEIHLGRKPEDLLETLVNMVLGSPAICIYRSNGRSTARATSLAKVFVNNFNLPESTAIIDLAYGRCRDDNSHWQNVLKYCKDGCFQAMIDEYIHMLKETAGFQSDGNQYQIVHDMMMDSLKIHTATYIADTYPDFKKRINGADRKSDGCRIRSSYAVGFTKDAGDNSKVVMRKENIRNAFNSPMRPFVLATTSIGQEGLDFHNYCRVIMHWNLPSNPIDVGRILRTFKIKKNVEVTDNGKIII